MAHWCKPEHNLAIRAIFNQFSDFGSSRCKKVICFPYFTKPTPGYTLENHPVPACIHTASNGEMEASRWEATLSLSALFPLLLYTFFLVGAYFDTFDLLKTFETVKVQVLTVIVAISLHVDLFSAAPAMKLLYS